MNEQRSTRTRLLDAALDAFARGGYAGASIRAITRAVGVRESAFYAHFASKKAAYDELMAEAGPAVVARIARAIPEGAAPAAAIAHLASAAIEAWSTARARAFASIAVREAFGADGELRDALLAGIGDVLAALGSRFAGWQQQGAIRSGAPPEVLAYELMAPIVLARFTFFSHAASEDEMRRGRQLVDGHAHAFAELLAVSPAR